MCYPKKHDCARSFRFLANTNRRETMLLTRLCHKPNFLQGFTSNKTWIDVHGLVIMHKGRFRTDFCARFGDMFWLATRNLLDFSTYVSIFFQLYVSCSLSHERWSRPKSFELPIWRDSQVICRNQNGQIYLHEAFPLAALVLLCRWVALPSICVRIYWV